MNNPLMTSTSYPYTGHDDTCAFDSEKGVVHLQGYHDVPPKDPEQLKAAVALGPVSVAIQASGAVQFYAGGVINTPLCGSRLDHGVTVVGYG
jgi:hypothetical protein